MRLLNRLAFLLALAFAALAQPALAQTPPISPEQRKAIEAIVRETLIANPEILQEALTELERRQQESQKTAQATALQAERAKIFNGARDYVAGNPAGEITLVEFFDYNCGYCKRALTDIKALVKADPKLKVVLKDFPVLGPGSVEAARVALAARPQLKADRQLDFHVKLMESRGQVNGERALAVAKELGLDMARLTKEMESEEVRNTIRETVELGDKLGLTGTPAFIIGEEIVFGAVGVEPLKQAIANVRQCGKATCS